MSSKNKEELSINEGQENSVNKKGNKNKNTDSLLTQRNLNAEVDYDMDIEKFSAEVSYFESLYENLYVRYENMIEDGAGSYIGKLVFKALPVNENNQVKNKEGKLILHTLTKEQKAAWSDKVCSYDFTLEFAPYNYSKAEQYLNDIIRNLKAHELLIYKEDVDLSNFEEKKVDHNRFIEYINELKKEGASSRGTDGPRFKLLKSGTKLE